VRIPATGLQAARTLLDVHAHNIANVSTEGFRAQRAELRSVDPRGGVEVAAITERDPDLVEDVVGLITAKTMYAANATVFALLAETERSLLDVRA
jgi:flagellar hook protein FlgE